MGGLEEYLTSDSPLKSSMSTFDGSTEQLANTLRRSFPYLSFPPGRARAFAVLMMTVAETTSLLKCYWRKVGAFQ